MTKQKILCASKKRIFRLLYAFLSILVVKQSDWIQKQSNGLITIFSIKVKEAREGESEKGAEEKAAFRNPWGKPGDLVVKM